jgi:hypothetical protein
MNKIKKFFFFSIFVLVILEIFSFFIYKSNLLEISHKPEIYMNKGFVSINKWWTEENIWGPWHKKNSKTRQIKSCYNVIYEANEIGARDESFNLNSINDIILIGDSFAEGYGVNYDDTSQKYIENLTGFNVLNFGVSKNFGPVQYSIIYDKLAKNYKHNKLIIYFLPDNDFGENDYSNWKGSYRFRPYYKKINDNFYETFIPNKSIKNYSSFSKKIKIKLSEFLWSSNLFINLNYQYRIYRSAKKNTNNDFSAYFDAKLEQQKATIFFLDKIIDKSMAKVFLVSIPRMTDFKKYQNNPNVNKTYWNNYFSTKDLNNTNFKFIDLIKFKPKLLNEIFLECDGHWSPKGNLWAAKIISGFIK